MNERVVEILVFIVNQIREDREFLSNLDLLSEDLLDKGYSQNEITSAFSWLLDRTDADFEEILKNVNPESGFSFRVLHDLEAMIISPEAYGYLLQLKSLDLLDDFEIECIIERSMMLGSSEVDLIEIKPIVASILAQTNRGSTANYEMIESAGATIH